jgi:hypothetical protein
MACEYDLPLHRDRPETLKKFTGYYRILSEEFREVTGALVDAKNRIILPAEKELLDPISLIRELWNTKHAPSYCSNPDNIE